MLYSAGLQMPESRTPALEDIGQTIYRAIYYFQVLPANEKSEFGGNPGGKIHRTVNGIQVESPAQGYQFHDRTHEECLIDFIHIVFLEEQPV